MEELPGTGYFDDELIREIQIRGRKCSYQINDDNEISRSSCVVSYKPEIVEATGTGARNKIAGRVTVKVVKLDFKHLFELDTFSGNWLERMRMLRSADHEHLQPYHKITVLSTPDADYSILAELVMGYTLRRMIKNIAEKRRLLGIADAVRIALDITKGLEYLHDHRITHGDLSPVSVFLVPSGSGSDTVMIGELDGLGILHVIHGHSVARSENQSVTDTVRYMSPEMLTKVGKYGPRYRVTPQQTPPPVYQPIPSSSHTASTADYSSLQSRAAPSQTDDLDKLQQHKTDIWSVGCITVQLLNCATGDSKAWISRGEIRLEVGLQLSDVDFAQKIMAGYGPAVAPSVPKNIVRCTDLCLRSDPIDRISASELRRELEYCLTKL